MNTLSELTKHVEQHPKDYQAVLALLKKRSDEIDYQREQKKIARIKLYKERTKVKDGKRM